MSRNKKWRKVCCMPGNFNFGPLSEEIPLKDPIILTVDEYEALRLIDFEGFNQEKCANKMKVSRTTVQGIYNQARKKVAKSLVLGKEIRISGGEFKLCDGESDDCNRGCGKAK